MEQLKYAGLRIEDKAALPTWNDAINAMSIDEKALMFDRIFEKDCPIRGISEAEHRYGIEITKEDESHE